MFEEISEVDGRLAHALREAIEYALDGNPAREAEALSRFVHSEYVNPDFVPRTTVARRILALDAAMDTRRRAEAFVNAEEARLQGLRAEVQAQLAEDAL